MAASQRSSRIDKPVFGLVDTVEVEIAVGEDAWSWRVELFHSQDDPTRYRYRAWEIEFFRLHPTFPQDNAGQPVETSDDQLHVHRVLPGQRDDERGFAAASTQQAMGFALDDLRRAIERLTSEAAGSEGAGESGH